MKYLIFKFRLLCLIIYVFLCIIFFPFLLIFFFKNLLNLRGPARTQGAGMGEEFLPWWGLGKGPGLGARMGSASAPRCHS